MTVVRWLIFSVVAFASGALVARRGDQDSLRRALRPSASRSVENRAVRDAASNAAVVERTSEERFGHVLSALQDGSQLKRRHDLYEAVGDLSPEEVAEMIERALRLPSESKDKITIALLERWFELEPERARMWLRERPREERYWKVWAMKSPESLIAEMDSQRHGAFRWGPGSFETAVKNVAGPDIKAQASLLTALPAGSARDQLLSKTMAEWSSTDAGGAFAFARTLPASALRQRISESALRAWATADPRRAAQQVGALLPELTPDVNGTIGEVAGALAQEDPQAALRWLNELPEEYRGVAPYVAAARVWAKTEPLAALAWSLENGMTAAGRADVLNAAMEKHPLETVQWVQTLPPGEERDRLIERAVTSRSKLNQPPVSDANAEIVIGLLQQLPADAQEAAAYQLGWMSGNRGKIEDVMVWTEGLAEGALRAAAVEAAVRYRFGANPYSRQELLNQFPSGPERDGALAGIAAHEREPTPIRAIQTAIEIGDPAARHDVLDHIIGEWIERNRAQARAWLVDATTLPPDWKDAWLAEAGSRK